MAKGVVLITRFISIVAALAVTVAVVCFPRLVAIDMHAVPHGWLVCLLLGMSFAYVHGFGFIPENKTLKILFSPLVALAPDDRRSHDDLALISIPLQKPMHLHLSGMNTIG